MEGRLRSAFFVAVGFRQLRIRRTLSTFPRLHTVFSSRSICFYYFLRRSIFSVFIFLSRSCFLSLLKPKHIHMKVTREQAQETIAKEVSAYLEKYGESTGVPLHILASKESREHVVIVGTSIMMNRLGFNTFPGSFVQAVLNDSLSGAFNRADSINQQSLRFYATMMHSLGINISPE